MTTTVFSTPCWKSARPSLARALTLLLAVAIAMLLAGAPGARAGVAWAADVGGVEQLRVDSGSDGVHLSLQLRLELPAPVQEALLKGIALHFVHEADIYRDRWYWYDKRVTSAVRSTRLSYQPLTRRWRLQTTLGAPAAGEGSGLALGQSFDSLDEALATLGRLSRWKISDGTDIDSRHTLDFRFRLDLTQLPRPFQIGIARQDDWNIAVSRVQRIGAEAAGR